MSEFKFACPVCGQHITADSSSSGTNLVCPTCFRKIVVPQAPASGDSKLILTAAQAERPRAHSELAGMGPAPRPRGRVWPALAAMLVVAAVAAAGYFAWRRYQDTISRIQAKAPTNAAPSTTHSKLPPRLTAPVPTNLVWTLDLAKAEIPDAPAVGVVHGYGFRCDRAVLKGGWLELRLGKTGTPDLAVAILTFARTGEELSNKTIEVSRDRLPPLPQVLLGWRDEDDRYASVPFQKGYVLKLHFGPAAGGRVPGKLYLGCPDGLHSFVAGTFEAEIHRPQAGKGPQKPSAK
jgi:hypothetical protein